MESAKLDVIPRVRGPRLVDEAWQRLHRAIVDGSVPPGTKLVEAKLAAELNISRTPVREAIRRLEVEGLVRVDSDGQKTVANRSADEIKGIYEVRRLLEEYAAGRAATWISPAEIEELKAVCDRAEVAARTGRLHDVSALNVRFHELVVAAARNPTLSNLFRIVHSQAAPYRVFAAGSAPELQRFVEGHREIIAALVSGDSEAAAEAVRNHTTQAVAHFLTL